MAWFLEGLIIATTTSHKRARRKFGQKLMNLASMPDATSSSLFHVITPNNSKTPHATFSLVRFRFYPFLLMKTLSVRIAPFSNKYAMKTIGVHTAPT